MEPRMNADKRRLKSIGLQIVIVCFLFCLSSLCSADEGIYSHRFEYDPPAGQIPRSVVVAGDFNGWSQNATPMRRLAGGAWSVNVDLPEGVHLYKFLVDGHWTNDSHSEAEF